MRRYRSLTKTAIAGGLLALAPEAHAAPDNTLGMALLGALINANGSAGWSSGLVDSDNTGAGTYSLTFDRTLTNCMVTATPAGAGGAGMVIRTTAIGASLSLAVNDLNGTATNFGFHVIVFCPR